MDLEFLETTGDGAWIVDENQILIGWNKAACDMFGYAVDEVIGRSCHDVICGETFVGKTWCRDNCFVWDKVNQGNSVVTCGIVATHSDGQSIPISMSTFVYPSQEEKSGSKIIVHLARPVVGYKDDSTRLRIQLLGKTAVQREDGSAVDGPLWGRVKVRGLLAFFALLRGRPVYREPLLQALWPDLPQKSAMINLNTAIYSLRRALEPNLDKGSNSKYISYQNGQYRFTDGHLHWLDVTHFEDGLRIARRQVEPINRIAEFKKAVALYNGDFLADLDAAFEWHLIEHERLQNIYLNGLEELGLLLERESRDQEAKEAFEKALTVDPCRERACQGLMRMAIKRGDRARAIACFQSLTESMQTRMSIAPSQETQRLYRAAYSETYFG